LPVRWIDWLNLVTTEAIVAKKGKTSEYSAFARALDLISRLNAGQRLSVDRLSQIYDVSKRQVFRTMAVASQHLPIVTEKVNGETLYGLMRD
jgi:predicted DNA-binding transcriptional regulator YafY